MKYRIDYSKAAIRDLDRVWSEVTEASKSSDLAAEYIDDLLDKIEAKADFPESGAPLYYEDSFTGYYFVVFKAYIAFYRIEENRILVERVLFAKSDHIRVLNL